jgi:hypothetical protein
VSTMDDSTLVALSGLVVILCGAVMYWMPLHHRSFRSLQEDPSKGTGPTTLVRGYGLGTLIAGCCLILVALVIRVAS